jgi:biopolymer transport protein ExbB
MLDVCFNSGQVYECGSRIASQWNSMGWLERSDIALLGLMLANTVVIVGHRLRRYDQARGQNRAFVHEATSALRNGDFQNVIALSARNHRSPIATVVASALTAIRSAPPELNDADAIDSAERAAQSGRRTVSADLRLGLGSLATTASCAPFVGLLGTVFGILNAFGAVGMAKWAVLAMIASNLAGALVTAALGVWVAIFAGWGHVYFRGRLETLERGMSNAVLELTAYLRLNPQYRRHCQDSTVATVGPLFGETGASRACPWEIPYDRQRALMLWIGCSAFYLVFLLARGMYWSHHRQHSHVESSSSWQQIGGQEAISPDRRYRAIVPVFFRTWEPGEEYRRSDWSCGSNPRVALRIIPNDRPLAWRSHTCGTETNYILEGDEALTTRTCGVPLVIWRTNDQLLLKCSQCSAKDLQQMKIDFFPHEITVLGGDGKRIYPRLVKPPPQCPD